MEIDCSDFDDALEELADDLIFDELCPIEILRVIIDQL